MDKKSGNGFRTIDLTLGALFVGLMAIGANIVVWLPFLKITFGGATVELTLQTFFATLAGLMLGKRLGAFSMFVYCMIGIIGVPVFAGMQAGFAQLITPTGGFILSFMFVAWIAGYIVEKSPSSSFATYLLSSFTALVVNYGIGTTYLYFALNTWIGGSISYVGSWAMMLPFLIKDLGLTFLVASLAVVLVKRVSLTFKPA
ncbi:biotin transport system substrate-specific component [Salinibacillus kushneri]|uniref:Biotin transporter n=1 Tax=Salinibacillus kushneri TaxID=237682 RepID=A0A1H9Y8M0_9BACI|nr:biotin transporter BioY [Salinibacillus kushneri]SES64728.1 biotin transport system substrate-specific component [Salinibacillus kushneri]